MAVDWSVALAELESVISSALEPVSSGPRLRQLRWVAGELGLAAGTDAFPSPTTGDLADLVTSGPLTAYLDLAQRGLLRVRSARTPTAASPASMRVRRRCLSLIAQAARLEAHLPPHLETPQPSEPASPRSRDLLRRRLEALAAADRGTRRHDERLRMLAAVGVVLDTGARVGELCAMRLGDLDDDLTAVTLRRRPQASGAANAAVEVHPLQAPTSSALHSWLERRRQVVAPLDGSAEAVWVSLRANHTPTGALRPAGLPLEPRGMVRAYQRVAAELNDTMAGTDSWEPLPVRMEQLRRSPQS